MPHRHRIAALAVAAACLGPVTAAHAGVFPGEVVDGPSADLVAVGQVDQSRDGTGGVAYVKRDGGVPHVFVARLIDGAWQPPERVDGGVADAASGAVLAAGQGGRLLAAWSAAGTVFAAVRPSAAEGWSAPQPLGPGDAPSVDLGINGHAYVVWSGGGDVRAARLERGAAQLTVIAQPLDADPAQPAGETVSRAPDVAVAGDGVGLVVWGEAGAVNARRLFGTNVSTVVQRISVDQVEGRPGGEADGADAAVRDDSSFGWVTFRQAFTDSGVTRTRALVRHLVGGEFEAPLFVDGQTWPAGENVEVPRIDMNGPGRGLVAVGHVGSGQVWGSYINREEELDGVQRFDTAGSGVGPRPVPSMGQNDRAFVAWLQAGGPEATDGQLRARTFDPDGRIEAELGLTKAELGPVDLIAGFDSSSDRGLDVATVAIQVAADGRRLVAAMYDREPGTFVGYTSQNWRRGQAPLSWAESLNIWGAVTYTVEVDGRAVGTTTQRRYTPGTPIPDGVHRWRVLATDPRGQATATPTRLLRIDGRPPRLTGRISRSGRVVRATAVARDSASGVKYTRISFDGGRAVTARSVRRFLGAGRHTIRFSATDNAGNATAVTRTVRVR